MQVSLPADNDIGSLVLGADSALLQGHYSPAYNERRVTLTMDALQVGRYPVYSGRPFEQPCLWPFYGTLMGILL